MKYVIVILMFMVAADGFSQTVERQVIGASGLTFNASNLQMDWTVGETVTSYAPAGTVFVTQGFNQPASSSLSIKPVNADNRFNVYPNPTAGNICFIADNIAANAQLSITDATGKLVYTGVWDTASGMTIDGMAWNAGIYNIMLTVENTVIIYRLNKL